MKTLCIGSSHGSAEACTQTGKVLSIDEDLAAEYDIDRFNVKELSDYCKAMGQDVPLYCDILNIGYWLKDGTYQPPEPDFRPAKHEYKSVFSPLLKYLNDGTLLINNETYISAQEMSLAANQYKGVNRIHKPIAILFWQDCKNGKASNWTYKQ